MAVATGTRLGPYEIVAPLGAGGMGEVYRARDARLGREVAIKVLRAEVAGVPERVKRFEREARTVAALSHPNILALFDVGTHEGAPYLVTELLEGQTLAERIRTGDVTVASAVELGTQIAQGLAAAHERGIVHRDLKPGNVFVTKDGVVKILDFGLARLTHLEAEAWESTTASTETGLTGPLAILGTVGYMAPEQVRGLPADHRSDIFSFGCVLYEMLSGQRAFQGETAADTSAAILHERPPDLGVAVAGISPRLDAIVTRCLAKAPEDRFQSTRDLAHDLGAVLPDLKPAPHAAPVGGRRRWRVAGLAVAAAVVAAFAGVWALRPEVASGRRAEAAKLLRIVVLPFENLGAPEDAYFAAGMTEEITSRLANVQGLGVISRTTAMACDRTGKTVQEIGEDLGVDFVLEGSVRWERGQAHDSRVRITPQLIRVADDTHVWADSYDRVLADVFAMQSEVAENTVRAMGITLLPRERAALNEVSTSDMQAYDLYLRGRELAGRGTSKSDLDGAESMYQAAVDRDPRFAQALAGLARMHLSMYWFYYDRNPDRLVKARAAAERAVELRPDLAASHAALGWYFYWGRLDFPAALGEFAAALTIEPNNGDALLGMSAVRRGQGRWTEAVDAVSKAAELDPKDAQLRFEVGFCLVLARRYSEADRAFGQAIALSPKWAAPYAEKARLQIDLYGDLERSQAVLDDAGRVPGLTDDERDLAGVRLELTLARRDYASALEQLGAGTLDGNMSAYSPDTLLRGQVQRLAGRNEAARLSFEAARRTLEQRIKENPDDPRIHSSLGIAYAGLGLRAEAVREARRGCDLMPVSKHARLARDRLWDLVIVYTMVGQADEAVALLDEFMAGAGGLTPHRLRLDPTFDPLRGDPRFQALLTKYEVKEL